MSEQQTEKKKPALSTHVLDIYQGIPASNLPIELHTFASDKWILLKESITNSNGRCEDFLEDINFTFGSGLYKLHFRVDHYFNASKINSIYPCVDVIFEVKNVQDHYHIPLLLGPFGYTTYKGS